MQLDFCVGQQISAKFNKPVTAMRNLGHGDTLVKSGYLWGDEKAKNGSHAYDAGKTEKFVGT
jgi:hypothetical protein